MNAVHLSGKVSDYGPKLTYSEAGKPQTTFTLIVEEPGPTGTFKTFVPVVLVGLKEALTPLGKPEADKLTLPVKPFCGVTVTVLVPLPP